MYSVCVFIYRHLVAWQQKTFSVVFYGSAQTFEKIVSVYRIVVV